MLLRFFIRFSIRLTEKYTRGVSAVESILVLDRLRQSVAVKELEQAQNKTLSMRKTASVPNFSQVRLTKGGFIAPCGGRTTADLLWIFHFAII